MLINASCWEKIALAGQSLESIYIRTGQTARGLASVYLTKAAGEYSLVSKNIRPFYIKMRKILATQLMSLIRCHWEPVLSFFFVV